MSELIRAVKVTLVFVVLTGFIFPALLWGLAQIFFPYSANGSLIRNEQGTVIGSELIGQQFSSPRYFHPRPSAAGNGYDTLSSGGTNLGPTSRKLFEGVKELADQYRKENDIPSVIEIPADAVTRSGSGLDPEISPANALIQAHRIARERGLDEAGVKTFVIHNIQPRFLGIFGEPRVNVFLLNRELDKRK